MTATPPIQKKNIGLILLAAGQSSRLGQPKQLLKLGDQTLLQHSLWVAKASEAAPVVLVLGAHATRIKKELVEDDVQMVVNQEWEEGMAASIRCGVQELLHHQPATAGAVIMVCDQPFVTPTLINKLLSIHLETGKPLVCCQYAQTIGTPAFFHRSLFPELIALEGDVGAKSLLLKHAENLELLAFPEGKIDIDTKTDYDNLRQHG